MNKSIWYPITALLLIAAAAVVSFPNRVLAQGTTPVTCPGFVKSRLVVGGLGRDIPDGNAPILMEQIEPQPSKPHVLTDGIVFEVLDGPKCLYDTAQWQVKYNDTVGWLAEGDGKTYWLEPLPELGETYTDENVTFNYPTGWVVLGQQSGAIILGEEGTTGLLPGHFIVGVYEDAHSVPALANSEGTPLMLLQADAAAGASQGVDYSEPIPLLFGERMAAYCSTTAASLGMDTVEVIVELSPGGASAMLSTITAPGEAASSETLALAMAYTLVTPGSGEPSAGALTGLFGNAPTTTNTTTYVAEDGSFSFDYPADWTAVPLDQSIVAVINDPAIANLPDLDSFSKGQVLIFVYPTLASAPNYPMDTVNSSTVASTVASYYASMDMIQGYTQQGAIEPLVANSQQDSAYYIASSTGHEEIVIAADNGQGDYAVVAAYAAPGELEQYMPDLIVLVESFYKG